MDVSFQNPVVDTVSAIEESQHMTSQEALSEGAGILAQFYRECTKCYRLILRHASSLNGISKPIYRRLENSYSSLVLWAEGYGIADGELDAALPHSDKLIRATLELLVSLCRILIERLALHIFPDLSAMKSNVELSHLLALMEQTPYTIQDMSHEPDSEDDSSSCNSALFSEDDSLEEISADIKSDIQCLIDLGTLYESCISVHTPASWEPPQDYIDRIHRRFPSAHEKLVYRLAQSNWSRFLRCQLQRENNGHEWNLNKVFNKEAATVHSKSHDSGVGSSTTAGCSYEDIIMSFLQANNDSVKFPLLPDEAKSRKPFRCFICARIVRITDQDSWKKHVYDDLQPYVCHELSCPYGKFIFVRKEEWMGHLELEHGFGPDWKSISCPLCQEDTGDGKMIIIHHLAHHLEEIAFGALFQGVKPGTNTTTESALFEAPSERAIRETERLDIESVDSLSRRRSSMQDNDNNSPSTESSEGHDHCEEKVEDITVSPAASLLSPNATSPPIEKKPFSNERTAQPRKKPKIRTYAACRTCRRLYIICSEEKPTCRTCMMSNRHCEGYAERPIYENKGTDSMQQTEKSINSSG